MSVIQAQCRIEAFYAVCVIRMKVVLQNVVALPANKQRMANLILYLYSPMSMVVPSGKVFW
jgi:hypothetical protein